MLICASVLVLLGRAVEVLFWGSRFTGAAAVLLGSSVRVNVGVLLGFPPNKLLA